VEYAENPCAAVDCREESNVSGTKGKKKDKRSSSPDKRVTVEKKAFDKILRKLIQSPPVRREA
jgi:hypothetical protein